MVQRRLRGLLVALCRDLASCGILSNLGMGGNLSARDPKSGLIVVTPSQVPYADLRARDIVVLNEKGEVMDCASGRRPSSETNSHLRIYQVIPEAGGAIHTHSLYLTALGLVEDVIPATTHEGAFYIGKEIPVIGPLKPGSSEMADAVVSALSDCPATVIRNHGAFLFGKSVEEAAMRAVIAEETGRVYYTARLLGVPLSPLSA